MIKKRHLFLSITATTALFFLVAQLPAQQNTIAPNANAGLIPRNGTMRTADEGLAAEEFRRGVQAYYRGSFNEAILQFERALSYIPDDNLILDWLAKAYYRSGLEGTAIANWREASENGYGGLLLQNKIEIVSERRVTNTELDPTSRYTEAGSFSGVSGKNILFNAPSSVLPNKDGSFWVVAYGSNEVVKIDTNGNIMSRVFGPYSGFDRPLDIIKLADGSMLVTESSGDRLSQIDANGNFIKYIGEKGRGLGQCVGPQYAAQDYNGNIFVTDYGNKRVDVFDADGNALFFFGKKNFDFKGFSGPSGIAVIENSVFVADCITGAIYEFDISGNYKRVLVPEKTFSRPESLKVWGDWIVVCDSNRVVSVDYNTGAIVESAKTGNAPSRLTSAVPDINGNVLVTDFHTNEVYVMTAMQDLIGGFFVQITRVNADAFPNVVIEVQVENRNRQPVVGLTAQNFIVTENRGGVLEQTFKGASSNNNIADITMVLDRSVYSDAYRTEMENAVREVAASMNGKGVLRIVSAGKTPTLEFVGNPNSAAEFRLSAIKTEVSDVAKLDLALRLAANDLINAEPKRGVIYFTAGKLTQDSFSQYGLADTASYLNNNSIGFSVVQLAQGAPDEELEYLADAVGGQSYYVYRREGLSNIVKDIIDAPSGLYQFSYISRMQTNFGEAYLPVEVEVYLMNRSGRDDTGYFAPLE